MTDPAGSSEGAALEADVRAALARVEDPEVPITLADLGVLRSVALRGADVFVRLAPTRMGCPGRDEIARRIRAAVTTVAPDADVEVDWDVTGWGPEQVSERGADVLAEFGYALLAGGLRCPYCRSEDIRSDGEFGGSLCKRPYSCRGCGSTFDLLRGLER